MFNTREEYENAENEILNCDFCNTEEALHTKYVSSISKWISICYSKPCWNWLEELTKDQLEPKGFRQLSI